MFNYIYCNVLASIYHFFNNTSSSEIAENGTIILVLVGLGVVFFIGKSIFKAISSSEETAIKIIVTIVVIIAILLILGIIVNALTSSEMTNYIVGVFLFLVFVIVIGFLIYESNKD